MAYKVKITSSAIEDIQKIYDYIAYQLESAINAEAQISRIKNEIEKLDIMPNSFRLYPKEPWFSRGLRYFHVDNYLIFYCVDEKAETVTVLRVIYGKRNLDKIWT